MDHWSALWSSPCAGSSAGGCGLKHCPLGPRYFAAILGGALGNLIDRVVRADDGLLSGNVVDFIDVTWYAVFNVADMFVVCGCIVLVLYELRHRSDAAELPLNEELS